jgi:hypothetical protein
MSPEEATLVAAFVFLILAPTAAGFLVRLFLRGSARWRQPARPQPIANGFDASSVVPSVQRVRQDYVEALHYRPHPFGHHRGLLQLVRGSIRRFPYFQERESGETSSINDQSSGKSQASNFPSGTLGAF